MGKKYSKHSDKFRMVVNYYRIVCKAIDKSLQHWVNNFNGKTGTYRAKDCPLCRLFHSHRECGACPVAVYVRTVQRQPTAGVACACSLTPWANVSIHGGKDHNDFLQSKKCAECKKLAWREYKFLLKVRDYYRSHARTEIRVELLRGWKEEERARAEKKKGKKR